MISVFIIGSRGYTKKYGGWETLVHGLVDNQIDNSIHYYIFEPVSNKNEEGMIEIDGITCIKLFVKQSGAFQMIFGDMKAVKFAKKYVSEKHIENPIMLVLGARIGPIIWLKKHSLKRHGFVIMDNPGGVEWKRPKWGLIGRLYQYISCYFMGVASDNIVCDSEGIRDIYNKMIKSNKHKKDYAAYGVYPINDYKPKKDVKIADYLSKYGIIENDYYLIINRFMPENSYELILSEYVKTKTTKKLILITNIDKENKYFLKLSKKIPFEKDKRIVFVGTLYDKDILLYLRLNCYAYINGHTLGGTNPGLLEAMYSTGFVLAYDVVFSREVCADFALYFDKEHSLSQLIQSAEKMPVDIRKNIINNARTRMANLYSWERVVSMYEDIFKKSVSKGETQK